MICQSEISQQLWNLLPLFIQGKKAYQLNIIAFRGSTEYQDHKAIMASFWSVSIRRRVRCDLQEIQMDP